MNFHVAWNRRKLLQESVTVVGGMNVSMDADSSNTILLNQEA